ncbi:serine/threonine protein phosphatase [Bradyrhizobium jicamae]|uniref:metallophosphoesterase family protein n=1 Tax=Bradyrhizobium jicamae TaxID=280332 RepID=UPI001BAA2CBD|nr:metallophosphoesterase family protein [Bradyrhizobium jicamae]MBR0750732.1 serine/threonine protein phosphatase [Bradyrhizobium jicamae]
MLKALLSRLDRRARLPKGVRLYAVGDIHGCSDLLTTAFGLIDEDLARTKPGRVIQVFLGDYVDRGPNTRRTLDLLIGRGQVHETVFIKGNHEALLMDLLADPSRLPEWLQLGGAATLMSYGVETSPHQAATDPVSVRQAFLAALPQSHIAFLRALVPSYSCGDFFFAHAGAKPGIPLDQQSEEDLMWIREPFLSSDEDFGKVVVHGHTPVREPEIRNHRVNIDTGAYATGCLTVLAIEDYRLDFHFTGVR